MVVDVGHLGYRSSPLVKLDDHVQSCSLTLREQIEIVGGDVMKGVNSQSLCIILLTGRKTVSYFLIRFYNRIRYFSFAVIFVMTL